MSIIEQAIELLKIQAEEIWPDKMPEGILDDRVADMKSEEASDINNDGFDSQVEYLLLNGESRESLSEILELYREGNGNA